MMTIAWAARGDYDGGLRAARELGQVAAQPGNKFFMAWSHASVAYVALRQGDFATARDRLERSIARCDEVGDPITRWLAICWLGEVEKLTGDYASGRTRFEQVLHKGVSSEGDLARHSAIPDLGALMLALGEVEGAAAVIEPAAVDFENEIPLMRIPFLFVHGDLKLASGDEAGARATFDEAKESRRRSTMVLSVPRPTSNLGSWLSGGANSLRLRTITTGPWPFAINMGWCRPSPNPSTPSRGSPPIRRARQKPLGSSLPQPPSVNLSTSPVGQSINPDTKRTEPVRASRSAGTLLWPRGPKAHPFLPTRLSPTPPGPAASESAPHQAGPASRLPKWRSSGWRPKV